MDSLRNEVQLYLVTDRIRLVNESLEIAVKEAILGGVTMVQLREKDRSSQEFYQSALRIQEITSKYNVPLIINDRLDIALAINASGVHLGQNDLPADVARKLLGPNKIIGISAATVDEAKKAEKDGANYLGIGSFYPTITKKDTRKVTIKQLQEIKQSVSIPIVAIGGINQSNASPLLTNGADGIAVVSAILADPNPKKAASELKELLK